MRTPQQRLPFRLIRRELLTRPREIEHCIPFNAIRLFDQRFGDGVHDIDADEVPQSIGIAAGVLGPDRPDDIGPGVHGRKERFEGVACFGVCGWSEGFPIHVGAVGGGGIVNGDDRAAGYVVGVCEFAAVGFLDRSVGELEWWSGRSRQE